MIRQFEEIATVSAGGVALGCGGRWRVCSPVQGWVDRFERVGVLKFEA